MAGFGGVWITRDGRQVTLCESRRHTLRNRERAATRCALHVRGARAGAGLTLVEPRGHILCNDHERVGGVHVEVVCQRRHLEARWRVGRRV